MDDEMNSLRKNHTWLLVDRRPGQKLVKYRWTYKLKEPGSKEFKYKARLVAKGFTQEKGVDSIMN